MIRVTETIDLINGFIPENSSLVFTKVSGTQSTTICFNRLKGELYIGFGTTRNNVSDWMSNFNFWKETIEIGSTRYRVHQGFLNQYLDIKDVVFTSIRSYQPKTIYLCGFSQGSAIATLCHAEILNEFSDINVYTLALASPRVLSVASASRFENLLKANSKRTSFVRVNHVHDPVPYLPPCFLNFRHVGMVYTFEAPTSKEYPIVHLPGFYRQCLAKVTGFPNFTN